MPETKNNLFSQKINTSLKEGKMQITPEMRAEWNNKANTNPNFITKSEIWKAIRNHCIECQGSFVAVTSCDGNDWVGKCPLWPYRFGKRDGTNDESTAKSSLRKAIRAMCNQCMSGNFKCGSQVCGLVKIRWGGIHS